MFKRLVAANSQEITNYLNNNIGKIKNKEMERLRSANDKGFSLEQIKILADSGLNAEQLYMILSLPPEDITNEQLKFAANPIFDTFQIYQILTGFIEGLSMEQVKLYANPRFESYRMNEMKQKLKNDEDIDYILKSARKRLQNS